MNLESMYRAFPAWLQNVACTLEGWRLDRQRYGGDYDAILYQYKKNSSLSCAEIIEFRDRRLKEFVVFCGSHSPYYGKLFKEYGFDPSSMSSAEDLKKLPILTKTQLKSNLQSIAIGVKAPETSMTAHTSGSTGSGLIFTTTLTAVREQWAVLWRFRGWHGISPHEWCAYFGGRTVVPSRVTSPPFWRYNYSSRQILYSGYHLSEKNLPFYIAHLRKAKPLFFHGYPSLLSLLAAYIIDRNIDLGYQPKWVSTGAENLLEGQRALMYRAFGVFPIQKYGMAEGVANISECEKGRLHVDEDYAMVEFIPNSTGGNYRIVGTNMTNLATPLIRYEGGDNASLSDIPCDCGKPGRIIESVDGRLEDCVVTKTGAYLGRLDHMFKDMVNVREAQIHQKRRGAITLLVVRGQGYSQYDEDALVSEFRHRVGNDLDIRFEYVTEIPKTAAGKLRFVVSEIASLASQSGEGR